MPCVAHHRVTRERRVWATRGACDRWFRYGGEPDLDQSEWDIVDDAEIPYWGSGMMHPGPNGRDLNGPFYDTPDFEPAGVPPTAGGPTA